jgi:hypothetical protein
MPSNIDYQSINENFPVPGQDNDTQVFRDNFDTIKNSLRKAKDEIEDLQDNTIRSDGVNDLNLSEISNAVLLRNRDKVLDGGINTTGIINIDYQHGPYQIYKLTENITDFAFINFPGDLSIPPTLISAIGVGKVIIEIYSDQEITTTSNNMISGKRYVIISINDSNFTQAGSDSNTIGTVFTAIGPTSGVGIVKEIREITFADPGSGNIIKKFTGFPLPFYVSSTDNPRFIEVWRWRSNEIFVRYLGETT